MQSVIEGRQEILTDPLDGFEDLDLSRVLPPRRLPFVPLARIKYFLTRLVNAPTLCPVIFFTSGNLTHNLLVRVTNHRTLDTT